MFNWMKVAPQELKSVHPVEDSFSNKEMRTYSRIQRYVKRVNIFSLLKSKGFTRSRCASQPYLIDLGLFD